jgi:HSP20 family molecular chaperone IbpA
MEEFIKILGTEAISRFQDFDYQNVLDKVDIVIDGVTNPGSSSLKNLPQYSLYDVSSDDESFYQYTFNIPSGVSKENVSMVKQGNSIVISGKSSTQANNVDNVNNSTFKVLRNENSEKMEFNRKIELPYDAKEILNHSFNTDLHQIVVKVSKITEDDKKEFAF